MAISARTRFEVLKRDGFRCRYCGASSSRVELHIDHVTPVSMGGGDNMTNLVASCEACNLGKASIVLRDSEREAVASDLPERCEHWADDVGPPNRLNGYTGSVCGDPSDGVDADGRPLCARHLARYVRVYLPLERRHRADDVELAWWFMHGRVVDRMTEMDAVASARECA